MNSVVTPGLQARPVEPLGPPSPGAVWLVTLAAVVIFFGCIVSPPSLMDDGDAAQASIARSMLETGDWVTPRLNGVVYLEQPPLHYWLIALSFRLFGDHDWAARIPAALAAVLLCWLTVRMGGWGLGARTGWYAGLCLATSVGLFLFTRVLRADVMVTAAIATTVYAWFRALEDEADQARKWALLGGAAMGAGLLLKGLIAVALPTGAILLYLGAIGRLRSRDAWKRLNPLAVVAAAIGVAGFWHVAAVLRNPPYFDLTLDSQPGRYRGFFWFYFLNEHLLRFLGLRYPQDSSTVSRFPFLLLHLAWLFPWSVWVVRVWKLEFGSATRESRMRLLALCWIGFVLLFFLLSTTQEYDSMPAYPAFALLLGSAITASNDGNKLPARVLGGIATCGVAVAVLLLYHLQGVATPGDISRSLMMHPDPRGYVLSLGQWGDLTLESFAYLRGPLALAAVSLMAGALACWRYADQRAVWGVAIMMVLLAHSARMALGKFDPFLSSRALAEALQQCPPGDLIADEAYEEFSSVFYYSGRTALLLNGRGKHLDYGSWAPDAPAVFIDEAEFERRWQGRARVYLLASARGRERLAPLAGRERMFVVRESGAKYLLTNVAPLRAETSGAPAAGPDPLPGSTP